ncbi:hypothetical protein ABGB16_31680 [Micromonospora sp. B11E3]|uniref:golvesin C-terminal-like domain-containing protein n=1 Tax=Micromonospora sp. B11E3 TaxID=3153562 RepID=UPI00325E0838
MRTRRLLGPAASLLALAVSVPAGHVPAGAAPAPTPGAPGSAAVRPDPPAIAPADRDRLLPKGWAGSDDRILLTTGDANGLHVLSAGMSDGYAWRTVATLAEPGFDADQWIGNMCVTGSGRRAVVVYAPRTFTNSGDLFERGGFTAVVDLRTGAVTKLPVQSTLAYFSPGCGAGETAVLTSFRAPADGPARTRLATVDAARPRVTAEHVLDGELTSAVPVRDGIVAAHGSALVRLTATGPGSGLRRAGLVRATNVPFHLAADGPDAVVYADRAGDRIRLSRAAARPGPAAATLAVGRLGQLGTASPVGGRVFLTGRPDHVGRLPASIRAVATARDAVLSSTGQLAVTGVVRADQPDPRAPVADPVGPRRIRIDATVVPTARPVRFGVTPAGASATGRVTSPALAGDGQRQGVASASATDPVEDDRTCSVPRNDARTQVYQPTPRQVEWATDQAVTGNLTMTRPADWRRSGLPAWSPQGMFPRPALAGGGRVPAQVMLGILTQESNLWQASPVALPGVTANPLIGNYYGRRIYDGNDADDWDIHWDDADCGYGVAQVTDGMRRSGHAREGEILLDPVKQRAVALDYATNIAAGLQILVGKWNQTRQAGMIVNDGDPSGLENWFFALWAYNTGFYPQGAPGEPWGVGWANNPANPRYPADRLPFLEYGYGDAARPQRWPYQEKVLGWAGHPIESVVAPDTLIAGYRPAWWTSTANRVTVKPPVDQFCDATNDCHPGSVFEPGAPDVVGEPAGPCAHRDTAGRYDLRCWFHTATSWKDCAAGECGFELLRFDETYPEQPDGTSYPPKCDLTGLPAGALIIDDVPDSVPSVRPGCGHPWTSQGTFSLAFAGDANGTYPSKVDFHQVGGGFGGHFWFGHTRRPDMADNEGNRMAVTGTWTLNRRVDGWARVLVHLPDHGAHTQQARYDIELGNGTRSRVVLQRTMRHRWVSLGALPFAGTPQVRLSTHTNDGDGSEDVAFDAVAIQPLPAKPRNVVVSLGDSYASGEGASAAGGVDYYPESDNNGGDSAIRNACHRSRLAWSRQAVLPDDTSRSVGARADSWDAQLDHHLLACSGAKTVNLLPGPAGGQGQYGEVSQLDRGFLDEDTTLVTLSIGGNDARFGDIVKECLYKAGLYSCPDAKLDGDSETVAVATERRITGTVEDDVVRVLEKIAEKAPNARIVLMGYPQLLDNLGGCLYPVIDPYEAAWLNYAGLLLNIHLGEAVQRAQPDQPRIWFSDPTDEFAGKALCGDPESIHRIVMDKTPGDEPGLAPSAQSFHPTTAGAGLYATALTTTLASLPPLP